MRKNAVINLELAKDGNLGVKFYAKQYDDIKIKATIYDGLDAVDVSNQEVILYIKKPDGTIIEQMDNITIVDEEIIINASNQATAVLGECELEIILRDIEGETSTSTISYVVIEKLSTAIIDVIQSSNDLHHLTLIEELIERADASLLSIEADIREIQAYISTMEGSINVECETILATLKALRDEIIEDINNEVHTLKNDAVDEISTLKDESIEDVDTTRNNAVDEITALKDEILDTSSKALEDTKEAVEKAEEAVLVATETLETASNVKEEVEKLSSDICETIEYIEDSKNRAIEEIAEAVVIVEETKEQAVDTITETKEQAVDTITETKEQAVDTITETKEQAVGAINSTKDTVVGEVYATRDTVVGEINTAKNEAVGVINNTKDTAMGEMTAKKDALIEELSRVETGTVEGVDEAVKLAQIRLQEETVKSMWEVQECTVTQKEAIEALSRQEQGTLSQKTTENIERINNAGASIVEMVEGLDANIEQGLSDIDRTIREGKTEIRDLSNAEISRIRETGAEITEAVRDLEINTTDNIDRINRAGEGARNTIEAKSLAEQRDINQLASEQKTAIREAGNEKLEEINSILGVSKGEVEELLSTTRQEINTHRSDFANKVADSKEEINTLKDNSMSEMTTKKDELIEEILGSEIALKEDFKTLKDEYIAEIDARGTSRVDALQRMIDTIDALEEAVNRRLEISENRAETLENTLTNVDNKIAEIRPVLDNLSEMRNICVSLQAENIEANANIEELNFLHVEADTRIVELRRLIQEAKQYEDVVQAYIDSRGGNHEEIEARLLALEEALAELEIPNIDHLATKEELEAKANEIIGMIPEEVDLSPYATKEEVDNAINNIEIPSIEHLATKEELEKGLKLHIGDVGEDPHPVCYKTEPEMLERETHYIRYKSYDNKYRVSYMSGYIQPNYYGYSSNMRTHTWRLYGHGISYRTFVYESGEWKIMSDESIIRVLGSSSDVNTCLGNVYSTNIRLMDASSTVIVVDIKEGNPQEAPINNYDDATNTGNYYVYHQNAIPNSYTDNTEGILKVININGAIRQELLSLDDTINVYRIKSNNVWTEWKEGASNIDLSSIATKEELETTNNTIEELKALIGNINANLISNINDIVRGL